MLLCFTAGASSQKSENQSVVIARESCGARRQSLCDNESVCILSPVVLRHGPGTRRAILESDGSRRHLKAARRLRTAVYALRLDSWIDVIFKINRIVCSMVCGCFVRMGVCTSDYVVIDWVDWLDRFFRKNSQSIYSFT